MTRGGQMRERLGSALLLAAISSCGGNSNSGGASGGAGGAQAGSNAVSGGMSSGGASLVSGGTSSGGTAVASGGMSGGGTGVLSGGMSSGGVGLVSGGNGSAGISAGTSSGGASSAGANAGGASSGGAASTSGGVAPLVPCAQDSECMIEMVPAGCAGAYCRGRTCLFTPVDADGDGQGTKVCAPKEPVRGFLAGEDCDDANKAVHARADELCNGVDDNCDGVVDRFNGRADTNPTGLGATFQCVNDTWFATEWSQEGDVGPSSSAPLGPVEVREIHMFEPNGSAEAIPGLPPTLFRIERVTIGPSSDHTVFRLDLAVLAVMSSASRNAVQKLFMGGTVVQFEVAPQDLGYAISIGAVGAPFLLP